MTIVAGLLFLLAASSTGAAEREPAADTLVQAVLTELGATRTKCPARLLGRWRPISAVCGKLPAALDAAALEQRLEPIMRAANAHAWKAKWPAGERNYWLDRTLVTVTVDRRKGLVAARHSLWDGTCPRHTVALDAIRANGAELAIRSRVWPDYPAAARRQRAEGDVMLWVLVGDDGSVRDVCVLHEQPRGLDLGAAAVAAVEQWRYEPTLKEGVPKAVQLPVVLSFTIGAPAR